MIKIVVAAVVLICCCSASARAATIFKSEISAWQVQTSVYTKHFDPQPEHVNRNNLIDVEVWTENRWLYGFAVFDNSFGQPSQYLYVGHHWPVLQSEHVFLKLTGGLLHGYKKPYKNKIPLNDLGVAPAIVPSIGFRVARLVAEVQVLGTAGLTVTVGLRI